MARDFGRWFRFYDAVLDDPKVQRLNDRLFRAWVNLMCLANRNGGMIAADFKDIAFALRISEGQARDNVQGLISAGLIDASETGYEPHNWTERQFKSDVSNERVKRFRERSKAAACNGDETLHDRYEKRPETVSVTAPEAETDTEADQKQSRAEGERASAPHPEPPPVSNSPPRKPWPVDAVVPEPWLKTAGDELKRLGKPPVDLPLVAAKFQAHYAGDGQARTQTEWQGLWVKFVLNEYRGKSNGSPGQPGGTSLATKVFGGGYAAARAGREGSGG